MTDRPKRLDPHHEREVAVLACVDPRSVRSYLAKTRESRSTTAARIEQALRQLGLAA